MNWCQSETWARHARTGIDAHSWLWEIVRARRLRTPRHPLHVLGCTLANLTATRFVKVSLGCASVREDTLTSIAQGGLLSGQRWIG